VWVETTVPQFAHCTEWWPFGAAWTASGAAPAAATAATRARRVAMVESGFMMFPLGIVVMLVCWEQPNGSGLFRKERKRIKCKRL
jgi:hypothetical protein